MRYKGTLLRSNVLSIYTIHSELRETVSIVFSTFKRRI